MAHSAVFIGIYQSGGTRREISMTIARQNAEIRKTNGSDIGMYQYEMILLDVHTAMTRQSGEP
jgi:hypothetical protein